MRMEHERGFEGYGRGDADDLHARPLGDLMRELLQDAQDVLREELRYAKAELRHEAKKAARGGAEAALGGAVLYVALGLLGATLILVGATFLPAWLSALVVTVLYAVVGGALLKTGKDSLSATDAKRPVERLKEDGRWARDTMRDVRSSRSGNA